MSFGGALAIEQSNVEKEFPAQECGTVSVARANANNARKPGTTTPPSIWTAWSRGSVL
ncbi:hypothetical protein FRC15_004109 [Serendipita sp. 397]|nr:hypothetical protein FRC15_004109 [Serendipita sp. 397]KAG8826109.1 hypothetical protein FRC18_010135 [Serendipita sp. 400]